jgi:glutamate/tyrosine decarboxylase-like PLP-dependent enzyme
MPRPLPDRGLARDEVLAILGDYRGGDVRWHDGRAFTLTYVAGQDVQSLAADVHAAFLGENALNVDAFPSLRRIQLELLAIVSDWLDGGDEAAGFLTSGGTESILMAVLAARERGRAERGVGRPNVVLPTSAHAAFEKAAHYFDVESRRVPVGADWRADVDAIAAAIDASTVLVVGSAPQYPQGVIDPIGPLAALAAEAGASCHVDACMGGAVLPYLARLGLPIPPWTFAVPGVTSISVDLHKFGYTPKGASAIVHRNRDLRRYQTFTTDRWLGGRYGSSGVLGTKSGAALAAAWAVVHHLGDDGYLRLAAAARRATEELAAGIAATAGLVLRAEPETVLVAFGAADPARLDVFALADALWERGWYVDRQGPPPSLHCTVNAIHDGRIPEFLTDLRAAVNDLLADSPTAAGEGSASDEPESSERSERDHQHGEGSASDEPDASERSGASPSAQYGTIE